jgi:hypothetical protein
MEGVAMEEMSLCDYCKWFCREHESFQNYCDKGHEIGLMTCPDFVEFDAPPVEYAERERSPSSGIYIEDEIPF